MRLAMLGAPIVAPQHGPYGGAELFRHAQPPTTSDYFLAMRVTITEATLYFARDISLSRGVAR